ncbi:helix-turn-helix domain-containing protein [Actinobacillus vicugnae]|uniref:helix-turn-helix domain-containing protein n=1 Tax=Actinobacillus vicugnae TaxID=2573093 RepID=UPI0012404765|nr:helix-turn-helix domain-containing protein [Actinobacillus vicugnae]
MKNFTDCLNRLKTELSLTMDKDIAAFLGLSKSAFAERKRRGVFPEEALRLADLSNPHLKLDVEYILTGKKGNIHSFLAKHSNEVIETAPEDVMTAEVFITPKDADTNVLLNFEETLLLSNYRRSDSKGKKAIFDMAQMSCDLSIARMRLNEYTEKELLREHNFTED